MSYIQSTRLPLLGCSSGTDRPGPPTPTSGPSPSLWDSALRSTVLLCVGTLILWCQGTSHPCHRFQNSEWSPQHTGCCYHFSSCSQVCTFPSSSQRPSCHVTDSNVQSPYLSQVVWGHHHHPDMDLILILPENSPLSPQYPSAKIRIRWSRVHLVELIWGFNKWML